MYSKTATQFEFMMKTAMIVLFVFGLFIFFVDITKAAQWVNNPANCAIQSPGGEVVCQTSETPNSRVCGVSGVQYYCYSSVAVFVAPGYIQNNNASQSALGGGYIMNCEANDSAPPSGPFCDNNTNFWCNSAFECNSKNRITTCQASKWAYQTGEAYLCGSCDATHLDCGGDDTCEIIKNITPSTTVPNTNYGNTCDAVVCQSGYGNCDSDLINGCEIQFGVSSCTTGGGEPGVFTACGVCTALPPKNFLTASNTDYYSDNPLLWGTQLGSGDLINFGNATSSNIFVVKNDASVFMSSTLATTTDKYFYNYNGDLYWGETKLNTGGGVYTAGSGLNLDGYEFTVSTTQDFNWFGQHTFNATTTSSLGVWGSNGKVGIGTTTPSFSLSLVVGDYDGLTIFNTSGQMMAGIGVSGNSAGLALFNGSTGDMDVSFNSTGHSWINNSRNFGIGTTSPDYKFTLDGDGFFMARGLSNNPVVSPQGVLLTQVGEGTRTFFYPRKAAFRTGGIMDMSIFPEALFDYVFTNEVDQWDDVNIGLASFAANVNNKASGDASAAFGVFNSAVGLASFVGGGVGNYATNTAGVVGGRDNQALNWHSFIGGGFENTTLGWSSAIVGGKNNTSTGFLSFIGGGEYNEVIGDYSVAFGEKMRVEGEHSFGINLSSGSVSSTLTQDNAFAIMGGNVGINTTTLDYTLNVQMEVGAHGGFGIYGANGNLLGGFGNLDLTGITSNGVMGLYYDTDDPMPNTIFAAYGHSFLASSTLSIGSAFEDGWNSSLMVEGGVHIENGVLRFNNASGTFGQLLMVGSTGYPVWTDVINLLSNNTTTFNSSTEFNSTSTFNNTAIFNNPSIFNDNVFVSGTIYSDNLTVYGTTTLNDIFVTGQSIFHDILPDGNLVWNIGTSSAVWKEGWFGEIFTNEISFINNWKLTTTSEGGLAFVSSTQTALAILPTGQIGINTTTVEANLQMKVDGNIGSKLYCDVNGNNCFDPRFGWSMPQARYMNTTTADYNGNFGSYGVASGTVGYEAANHICSSTVGAGYHICQANEILDIIRIYSTSTFVGKINGWVANGPPGYVTVSTNDCEGYSTSSGFSYGAWWKFNENNGGGSGKMISCNSSMPISCCK